MKLNTMLLALGGAGYMSYMYYFPQWIITNAHGDNDQDGKELQRNRGLNGICKPKMYPYHNH